MGFIKHALIGIALYEAVKYCLRNEERKLEFAEGGTQPLSSGYRHSHREDVDVIAGARQSDHLERKEYAASRMNSETPLMGEETEQSAGDPWKNSLANDDLRPPDS